jgi:hypothetical protein
MMDTSTFFSVSLITLVMAVVGAKAIKEGNYYQAAMMFGIPAVGWLTAELKAAGVLT